MKKNDEKRTVSLTLEKDKYHIVLKPTRSYPESQEFAVSMNCKKTFIVTEQALREIDDIAKFVEMEVENILRDCLETGIPKEIVKEVIDNVFLYGDETNPTVMYRKIIEELNLERSEKGK